MGDKLDLDVFIGSARYPLRVPRGITVREIIDYLVQSKGVKIDIAKRDPRAHIILSLETPLEHLLDEQIVIEIGTGTLKDQIEDMSGKQ